MSEIYLLLALALGGVGIVGAAIWLGVTHGRPALAAATGPAIPTPAIGAKIAQAAALDPAAKPMSRETLSIYVRGLLKTIEADEARLTEARKRLAEIENDQRTLRGVLEAHDERFARDERDRTGLREAVAKAGLELVDFRASLQQRDARMDRIERALVTLAGHVSAKEMFTSAVTPSVGEDAEGGDAPNAAALEASDDAAEIAAIAPFPAEEDQRGGA